MMEAEELLNKKELFNHFLKCIPSHHSSYSFVNLFVWQDFFDFQFEMINECLCVFAKNAVGKFMYLPPLGKDLTINTVHCCFEIMQDNTIGRGTARIENVLDSQIDIYPEDKFDCYKKEYEYCYFRENIVSLKGSIFKAKRNAYNLFVKNYKYEIYHYDSSMHDECMMLYDKWASDRKKLYEDDIYVSMLEENRKVHDIALKYYKELGLEGRVVLVDNAIAAYTFGYPLNDRDFCVLLEITDLNIKGLSVFIFREFCADVELHKYKFINVMDDFALKNIEKTKLSFNPLHMISSFSISKK